MADFAPQWEIEDVQGKTVHYGGTVGVTSALIPAVAVGKISCVFIRNPTRNTPTKKLDVAVDGGTTYTRLDPGEYIIWTPKNNLANIPITQVQIVGLVAGVEYEIIMDFEP